MINLRRDSPQAIALMAMWSLTAIGCGSDQSVSGTIGGRAFHAREAYFGTPMQLILSSGQLQSSTAIAITDFSDGCSNYSSTMPKGGVLGLALYVDRSMLDASVAAPGTFSQNETAMTSGIDLAVATYTLYSATDQSTINATAATVNVTRVSSTNITGTVDLEFGSDHISGSFDASHCEFLDYVH